VELPVACADNSTRMDDVLLPILIADDEETDRLIWKLAFEKAGLPNPLVFVSNGQAAVNYLAGHTPPAMCLLDLKMPLLDGFDVLVWIALNKELRKLPVFVFSSSAPDDDIQKAKHLGARDFFIKPHQLAEQVQLIKNIHARCQGTANG